MNYKFIDLDIEPFSSYFLEEYIPKNNLLENISKTNLIYIQHHQKSEVNQMMVFLENKLKENYSVPFKVEYFSIFCHTKKQDIHVDGINNIRYCSLNLPLLNYENTYMNFYQSSKKLDVGDAHYYDDANSSVIDCLAGQKKWVLVNSGIPHNICGVDFNHPRITLCVRFYGNPTFEQFMKYIC